MLYLRMHVLQVIVMMEIHYYDAKNDGEGRIFCRITCRKSKYTVTVFPDDEAMNKIEELKQNQSSIKGYIWPVRVFEAV